MNAPSSSWPWILIRLGGVYTCDFKTNVEPECFLAESTEDDHDFTRSVRNTSILHQSYTYIFWFYHFVYTIHTEWNNIGNPHLWYIIYPVKCYISINAHAIKTNKQNACVHMAVLQYSLFKTDLFEKTKSNWIVNINIWFLRYRRYVGTILPMRLKTAFYHPINFRDQRLPAEHDRPQPQWGHMTSTQKSMDNP